MKILKRVIYSSIACSALVGGLFFYYGHENQVPVISNEDISDSSVVTEESSDVNGVSLDELNRILDDSFTVLTKKEIDIDLTETNLKNFLVKNTRIILDQDPLENDYNKSSEFFYCKSDVALARSSDRSDDVIIYRIVPKQALSSKESEEIPALLILDKGIDGSVEELHNGKISKRYFESFIYTVLNKFDGEIVFDKFKENHVAKSLADLAEASIVNGPTSSADECIQKLFEEKY